MKILAFAYPGDIDTPTGGYGYCRHIIAGLRDLGWTVDPISLGEGFPQASEATKAHALKILQAVPSTTPIVVDGLAFGVLDKEADVLARSHKVIALVHHPLALETSLSASEQELLCRSETRSLAAAHAVITSSPATARTLAEGFAVPDDKISVVVPGTARPAPSSQRQRGQTEPRLLSVGSLVPRKGHDMLIDALADLQALPWRLDIAGDDRLDVEHAQHLRSLITTENLQDRVTLHGALPSDDLEALYTAADIFVLATRYEGYGMAFAEATVRGLPIVATGSGAVADTIVPGTGLLFAPDDRAGFRDGLRRMISDAALRAECAAAAIAAANTYPTWEESSSRFAAAIEELFTETPA